jgi:transposase
MQYVAIDLHKRYSVASALNEQGQRTREARIEGNSAAGFAQFFKGLGDRSKVVIEATWNWGRVHDLLEAIEEVEEVVLAHPYKTRIIAEAQVKTDKLDARALARLLRADLVARAHIPSPETRRRKEVLRQRLFWVRVRTMVRNRVHQLLDRQPRVDLPQVSDLFGARGMAAMKKLQLPEPDDTQLRQDLGLLEQLQQRIRELEGMIEARNAGDEPTEILATLPGLGKILAAVVAAEVDGIERFAHPKKLLAYAGLVPTTHSSGGKTSCRCATSGCAGLLSKPPGSPWATRTTLAPSTGSIAPGAKEPTRPLSSSRAAWPKSPGRCRATTGPMKTAL